MEKTKIVIVDDKLVLGLLGDSRFLDLFPAIKSSVKEGRLRLDESVVDGTCKPCQVRSKQYVVDAMSVKKTLAKLSDEDKQKFKNFLNTEQVKVIFKSKEGK